MQTVVTGELVVLKTLDPLFLIRTFTFTSIKINIISDRVYIWYEFMLQSYFNAIKIILAIEIKVKDIF